MQDRWVKHMLKGVDGLHMKENDDCDMMFWERGREGIENSNPISYMVAWLPSVVIWLFARVCTVRTVPTDPPELTNFRPLISRYKKALSLLIPTPTFGTVMMD